jgi:hypothetical protein
MLTNLHHFLNEQLRYLEQLHDAHVAVAP